jgi:hypothetical protein
VRGVFVTAAVGFLALSGCGGGDAATSGRPTSPPTTSGPITSPTTPGSATSTTTGSLSSTPGPTSAPTTTSPAGGDIPRSTAPTTGGTSPPDSVEDFAVEYPAGWGPAGQLLATAFANGATCGSAAIVDRAPPDLSGPGARIEQSFVQVCWRGRDGTTLPEFMATTYGPAGGFQATTLAGRPAFVSRAGTSSTFFVDTSTRRYQVATAVAASAELEPTRLAQVERILESLSLPA